VGDYEFTRSAAVDAWQDLPLTWSTPRAGLRRL